MTMDDRIAEMRALRTAEDPCQRTDAHMTHRNWRSDDVGVCPGVTTSPEELQARLIAAALTGDTDTIRRRLDEIASDED